MSRFIVMLGISIFLNSTVAFAGDAGAGKTKSAGCSSCHGPDGVSPLPVYPNLAGQKEEYLIQAMKAYREGARKNELMNAMAKILSDSDIDNLAAYYSGLDQGAAVVNSSAKKK